MWVYIFRRLLIMIPTLFGITIVAFCIMQLAPGDPMLSQLDAQGSAGASSQTREAYLIQKRDLKLDKPLLLNFRWFQDYRDELRHAADLRVSTIEEIRADLAKLAKDTDDPQLLGLLEFLRSLDIPEFEERLRHRDKRERLAESARAHAQVFAEDLGKYGVTEAMAMLEDDDVDEMTKKGVINLLNYMVVNKQKESYSRDPSPDETPLVTRVWETWWERERDEFDEIDPDRLEVLENQFQTMTAKDISRSELFELLLDEYSYDREDMPFFAKKLLGDSSLAEKAVAASILNLYVARPLEMEIKPDAGPEQLAEVIENWRVHYEPRADEYRRSAAGKLWDVIADTQYAHMVARLATFQFGRSALKTREPVSEKIWDAVVVSAPLMLMAQLVIYLVSIPLGITCAVNRGNVMDRTISLGLFVLYSIPPFVAGMLFLLFFCYGGYWKWFPMGGLHSDGAEQFGFVRYVLDYLWHAFLPVTCLSLFSLAAMAMYSRTSMLDVISQDFIRTARAKGVGSRGVIYKHAFRNSLIPILTLFSNFLPAMLGGSVLIEVIFNIPGMGRLGWASIELQDFPTLMALIYIQAIVVLVSILLTDVLYVVADPRIGFESQGRSR